MAERYQEKYDAFIHELYETYSRLIYKEAWKYFDSLYDVEDLVQEVWIKLCQKADQLYNFSKAQIVSYIATSVKNNAISMLRKQHPECPLEYADNIAYHEAELLNNIMDRKMRIDAFREIWPCVPAGARELLERKYILNESDAEIADAMGIGKNSVRMALSRARKSAFSVLEEKRSMLL